MHSSMRVIERPQLLAEVKDRLRVNPIVLLLLPRQCGKTTLARRFAAERQAEYFDLEAPRRELPKDSTLPRRI